MNALHRTYKFRLLPRKGQHRRLRAALDHTRDLYNAALQERIEAYRKCGKSVSHIDQTRGLTELRADPQWAVYACKMQRWPLKKLDDAFRAFFRRVKAGEKPGFPRFKGTDGFKSFGFSDRDGWGVDGARLRMKGIGSLRMQMHRPLPSKPIACHVKRDARGWFALLVCEIEPEALAPANSAVGIDVGILSFAALSDGETIPNPRHARRIEREQRRRHRQLARCKRDSRRRRKVRARLAALRAHEARARRTHHHQIAARIVRENDLIAVEDLNFRGLARSRLARDVADAGWGAFITLLAEKAEKAGRELVRVDCRGTSQTCPECGTIAVKTLAERWHSCPCGCVGDRDVIAAREILRRAVVSPGTHNVARWGVRAAGNIG